MITALFDEILVGNLNPSSLMRRTQNITFEKYTCPELFFFFSLLLYNSAGPQ
jgi:hypothetical protein